MLNNLCPKCSGTLYINLDKDLSCRACGKSIALRRELDEFKDTRRGKRDSITETTNGSELPRTSNVFGSRVRRPNSQNKHITLVRTRSR